MDLPRAHFPDLVTLLQQFLNRDPATRNAQASVPRVLQRVKSIKELWLYKQQPHLMEPTARQSQHLPYHHLSVVSQRLLIPTIVTGWELVHHVYVGRGKGSRQLL